ncbi:MAG: haloacid dehalogenase type II [Polynucleobacter sp.]|nr:haloacid dehalogenase type II [Polynucleobacter sp.]
MPKLIAFDAYGTLLDVYSMGVLAETLFPGQGQSLTVLWRDRQIEYTRLITMSDPTGSAHYLSFWDLTIAALRFSCKRLAIPLDQDQEAQLMSQYAKLSAFSECQATLSQIKQAGIATAVLSNGNQAMLSKALQANQLDILLDRVISVDEVRQFKVSPASYGLLTSHFGCAPKDILFVSSNAWDVIGAGWFGLKTFWVNRQNLPFEEIGPKPTYTGANLNDVLTALPA